MKNNTELILSRMTGIDRLVLTAFIMEMLANYDFIFFFKQKTAYEIGQ